MMHCCLHGILELAAEVALATPRWKCMLAHANDRIYNLTRHRLTLLHFHLHVLLRTSSQAPLTVI